MLTIQQQIALKIEALEVALSIKLRKLTRVRYKFERDRDSETAWIFWFDEAPDIHTLARADTIDEALEAAMRAILAMRSYEDELEDLGVPVPVRAKAEAA